MAEEAAEKVLFEANCILQGAKAQHVLNDLRHE